jgi:hypothetical protein
VGDIGDTASDVRLSPDSDAASVDIKARIDGASLDVSLDIGAGHLIFVTSSTHTGKIGGLPGADAICAARAKAAARPGTYKALISDSQTDANARLSITQAVFNTAGQLVASGPADLWDGDVKNTVAYDEHGVQVTSVFRVWCGTRDSGVKYGKDLCQDWGSDAKTHWGEIGTLTSKVTWIDDQAVTCDKLSRIYCISQ